MISQRCAIFDMDGTLLDSMPYWRNVLSEYLSMPIPQEYSEKIAPMNVTDSIALTIKTFGLQKSVKQIFDEMNELMRQHYLNDISPKKGVVQYLEKLRRNNVRMCIASASPAPLIQAALKNFDMLDFFDFLCSTEEGFPDKTHPDIFLHCAQKLNSVPFDTAVFEDSYSAIQTAKNANFHVVAIYDDTQKKNWQQITQLADMVKESYI